MTINLDGSKEPPHMLHPIYKTFVSAILRVRLVKLNTHEHFHDPVMPTNVRTLFT